MAIELRHDARFGWAATAPGGRVWRFTPDFSLVQVYSGTRWSNAGAANLENDFVTVGGLLAISQAILGQGVDPIDGGPGGVPYLIVHPNIPDEDDELLGTVPNGVGMNGNDQNPYVDLAGGLSSPSSGGPLVVIAASAVVARAAYLRTILTGLFASGSRIPWPSIPGWLRSIFTALGFAEGLDFIMDLADGNGVELGPINLPSFGGGGGNPGAPSGEDEDSKLVRALYVSGWTANGVAFYRLSDGRLATRNKHGVWKLWRPKKPTVIFSTGATDLQTFFKADGILDKQSKRMAKSLRRRGYQVRKKQAPSE